MAERPNESAGKNAVRHDDGGNDARLEFIYQKAENMNTRAGSLIFATAFASSLLGGRALSDGLGSWDLIAAALLFCIGGLIVFMLWPITNTLSASIPRSCSGSMSTATEQRSCPSSTARLHFVSRRTWLTIGERSNVFALRCRSRCSSC